jgi:hypothetical protein
MMTLPSREKRLRKPEKLRRSGVRARGSANLSHISLLETPPKSEPNECFARRQAFAASVPQDRDRAAAPSR